MRTKVFFIVILLAFVKTAKSQTDSTKFSIDLTPAIGGLFSYDTSGYAFIIGITPRFYYHLGSQLKIGITSSYGYYFSSEDERFNAYYFGPSIKYKIKENHIFYFGFEYIFENMAVCNNINLVADWPIYQYLNLNFGLDLPIKNRWHLTIEAGISLITNRNWDEFDNNFGNTMVGFTYNL